MIRIDSKLTPGSNQHQIGCNGGAAGFGDVDDLKGIDGAIQAFQESLYIAAYRNLVFDKDYAQSLIHKHHPVGSNNIDPFLWFENKCHLGGRCENRQGLLLVTI